MNLGIGLSVLKRVCRTIGLARWPYRKRQSLRNVIEQTKMYLVRPAGASLRSHQALAGSVHIPRERRMSSNYDVFVWN